MTFDVNNLPKSASMEVSAQAKALAASGIDIISLSIGDTHFPLPDFVQNRIQTAMESELTHYASAQGEHELRVSLCNYYKGAYEPEEFVITHGVKNGMMGYLMATAAQQILVVEPAWLGYEGLCILAGKSYKGLAHAVPDFTGQLKAQDFDALILCSPNNPDGHIFSEALLEEIYEICRSKNADLLIDEIYRMYDYSTGPGCATLHGREGVVVFNGFSKSHAATGLRLGFFASKKPSDIANVVKIQQNSITCPSTITQHGFVNFADGSEEVLKFKEYYAENKVLVKEIIPELALFEPQGGFYYFIDLKRLGINRSAVEFCTLALQLIQVAFVPGDAYGTGFENYFRLSFCVDREELREGLNRLKKMIRDEQNH